jgi:hypothetical protein
MNICFWCKRITDSENSGGEPEYRSYDFCSSCAAIRAKGITLIQVTSEDNGNPEIRTDLYPTGRWMVVAEENFTAVLTDLPNLDTVLRTKLLIIEEGDWEKMKLP